MSSARQEFSSTDPLRFAEKEGIVFFQGEWTVAKLAALEKKVKSTVWPKRDEMFFDGSNISAMDTAGAWLLCCIEGNLRSSVKKISKQGFDADHLNLMELVALHGKHELQQSGLRRSLLESIGIRGIDQMKKAIGMLSFIGENAIAFLRLLREPSRFRIQEICHNIETSGFNALPIIGLLSFLIGIVIAYQGGVQLRQYGANIYIVDLIGLSITREFAPLMTAILVAGRTGSAFAAQISTMKATEEIDAVRVLGLDPLEILVLPKLFALVIVMPLLTIYADAAGVFGGMLMSNIMLDVSTITFVERFPDAVSIQSYLIGIGKTPVFACIIALVGCYQGFIAEGSAESVGRQTTTSVVQAIFMIIIADAMFSVLFSWLGI